MHTIALAAFDLEVTSRTGARVQRAVAKIWSLAALRSRTPEPRLSRLRCCARGAPGLVV